MPMESKVVTHKLTNTEWQLYIENIEQTDSNKKKTKWLSVGLGLLKKPESMKSIEISRIFRVSDKYNQNVHAMGLNKKMIEKTNNIQGVTRFIPWQIIDLWMAHNRHITITIECWFAIQNINNHPWIYEIDPSYRNSITRLVFCLLFLFFFFCL